MDIGVLQALPQVRVPSARKRKVRSCAMLTTNHENQASFNRAAADRRKARKLEATNLIWSRGIGDAGAPERAYENLTFTTLRFHTRFKG